MRFVPRVIYQAWGSAHPWYESGQTGGLPNDVNFALLGLFEMSGSLWNEETESGFPCSLERIRQLWGVRTTSQIEEPGFLGSWEGYIFILQEARPPQVLLTTDMVHSPTS